MRGATCLFSAGAALRRVFLASGGLEAPGPLLLPTTRLFLPRLHLGRQSRSASIIRRVAPGPRGPGRGAGNKGNNAGNARQPSYKLNRLPRDEEITSLYVHVAGGGEGGKLSEPLPTRQVLADLDRSTHSLVVVAMPGENNSKGGGGASAAAAGGPRYPVCKVVDKKAQKEAAAERAKAARRREVATKELELNWAIAPHDLDHRLRQLRAFLGKGMRVQVLLLNKARKRRAEEEEARAVLARVREAAAEVEGTKEWKAPEGAVRASMKLFLEGPQSQSQSQSQPQSQSG